MHGQPPRGAAGIQLLVQRPEADAAVAELSDGAYQMGQRPAEPVEQGDDDRVAVSGVGQQLVELGAAGEGAAGGVGSDEAAAGGLQLVVLAAQVLVGGGDAGIAEERHAGEDTKTVFPNRSGATASEHRFCNGLKGVRGVTFTAIWRGTSQTRGSAAVLQKRPFLNR